MSGGLSDASPSTDAHHVQPSHAARFPAEWSPHDATWIAWPHHEPDWPGKLGPIPWVYAEIARVLAQHERVEILCHDETVRVDARASMLARARRDDNVRLHVVPTTASGCATRRRPSSHDERGQRRAA